MKEVKGIVPALITPFTPSEELDEDALARLLDHVIAGGVHGVFAIGSTGEFWAMNFAEKEKVYRLAVEMTAGRADVYLGTCANSTSETTELSLAAQEAGADFISILTPNFIKPNDDEMFAHYAAVAEQVRVPIVLYNNPPRTGNDLSVAVAKRLADSYEHVVGIKDSSGDLAQTTAYMQACGRDFGVLAGRDTLIFATLAHGGAGAIAASANIVPGLVTAIYEKFIAGDVQGALRAQNRLAPLRHAFSLGSFPVVLKEGVELLGLSAGPCRRPIGPMTEANRERLRQAMREAGCEVVK